MLLPRLFPVLTPNCYCYLSVLILFQPHRFAVRRPHKIFFLQNRFQYYPPRYNACRRHLLYLHRLSGHSCRQIIFAGTLKFRAYSYCKRVEYMVHKLYRHYHLTLLILTAFSFQTTIISFF